MYLCAGWKYGVRGVEILLLCLDSNRSVSKQTGRGLNFLLNTGRSLTLDCYLFKHKDQREIISFRPFY